MTSEGLFFFFFFLAVLIELRAIEKPEKVIKPVRVSLLL